jgi:hypothetical protein
MKDAEYIKRCMAASALLPDSATEDDIIGLLRLVPESERQEGEE